MPITFEQVDGGSSRFVWMTEIHKLIWVTTSMPESFQRIHFYPCIPDFSVSCVSSLSSESVEDGALIYNTELRLMQDKPISDGETRTSDGSSLDNQQRPCAVWASINGSDKTPLTQLSSGTWKSDKFLMNFPRSTRKYRTARLDCRLWIAFETSFSLGEKNTLKDLTELFVKQIRCDVLFSFENDRQIGGHLSILGARSPVFAAMFKHDMKESETGRVNIQDIQPDIFKELLHYIYSGRTLAPLTEVTAQPLFVAADKYDIGDLKEECIGYMLTSIRINNIISLLIFAHLHSIERLKEATLEFVTKHGQEICLQDEWEEFTANYPALCVLVTRCIIEKMSALSHGYAGTL